MAKFTLVIGNKNYSSWSLRPWLMLKYYNIPFAEVTIPLYAPGYKEKVLQYSPSGKVPCLLHGKVRIWESLAIGEYLADSLPKKKLWPQNKLHRAWARCVSHEMHAGFQALRKACPMDIRKSAPLKEMDAAVRKDVDRIAQIWKECREVFIKKGKFLFGHFTIADAMYMPVVFRFKTYGIALKGLAEEYRLMMEKVDALKDWVEAAKIEKETINH